MLLHTEKMDVESPVALGGVDVRNLLLLSVAMICTSGSLSQEVGLAPSPNCARFRRLQFRITFSRRIPTGR